MAPLQVVVSGIVTIVVYSLILAGVFKLFQIGTNLSEIKDLLQDLKRNTQDFALTNSIPPAPAPIESPAGLISAISAVRAESEPSPSPEPAAVDTESR